MSYLPVFLGLLTAVTWGTSDYISRRQSERVGYYSTAFYMHVTTFVLSIALVPLLSPSFTLGLYPVTVVVLAGALNFTAFIFLYRAFHRGVVSVVAPVAYTYPAVTTVFSVLLLGTAVTFATSLAISGIIVGVVLLSTRFSELGRYLRGNGGANLTAGAGSAIISSFSFGTVYVGVGYATPLMGYVIPVVFLRGVGSMLGLVLSPAFRADIRPSRVSFSPTIIAMGFLETIGFLSFSFGVSLGLDTIPIVAALSGMGGAVAAGYAISFLKERLELNQVIGILLSLGGVFALLYFGG